MIFTRYELPDGRKSDEIIDVSPATERLAAQLMQKGFRFEVELLRTGEVHLDCCNNERQLWNIVRPNGPGMRLAVEELVEKSYLELVRENVNAD
jgi:hypothetical protein